MNDDLISRKSLMEGRVENDPVRIAAICEKTAFDKEAVIKELRKYTDGPCALHECGIRSEYCSACMAKRAIEVVEKSGTI